MGGLLIFQNKFHFFSILACHAHTSQRFGIYFCLNTKLLLFVFSFNGF